MIISKKYFSIVFAVLFYINGYANKNLIVHGKIIDTVYCQNNPAQSYALYLPVEYSDSTDWPVMFIFDPAARGSHAVSHFTNAAEKYGYILICSNNSKNGPLENNITTAETIFEESFSKYQIDTNRVYTSGFSGGSRFASYIAIESGKISGIIACGAGFSNERRHKFNNIDKTSYVGIVGTRDMNYVEMHLVKNELNKLGISNKLIVYDGEHTWPDSNIVTKAFDWLEIEAFKQGKSKLNKNSISRLFKNTQLEAQNFESTNQLIDALQSYKNIVRDFEGIFSVSKEKERTTILENNKKLIKAIATKNKLLEKELKSYQEFDTKFPLSSHELKDSVFISFWKKEISRLNSLKNSKKADKANLGERGINKLIARCYEDGRYYILQKDTNSFIMTNRFWLWINDEDVYPHYYLARYYASYNNEKKTIFHLQKAIDNGLKNSQTIKSDKDFQFILDKIRID